MITQILLELFKAIADKTDIALQKMLGAFDVEKKPNIDLEEFMDELELDEEQRVKFRSVYQDYNKNPNKEEYEPYKYKYEPKSNDPFDKFEAYSKKYDDWFSSAEKKYDKAYSEYQKYRQQGQNFYNQHKNGGSGGGGSARSSAFSGMDESKYYQTLELKPGASFEEIKKAYKKAMKKYHPDRFQDESKRQYAEDLSRKINEAYGYFKKKHGKS